MLFSKDIGIDLGTANVLIYENEINVSKEQREIIQNICFLNSNSQ